MYDIKINVRGHP